MCPRPAWSTCLASIRSLTLWISLVRPRYRQTRVGNGWLICPPITDWLSAATNSSARYDAVLVLTDAAAASEESRQDEQAYARLYSGQNLDATPREPTVLLLFGDAPWAGFDAALHRRLANVRADAATPSRAAVRSVRDALVQAALAVANRRVVNDVEVSLLPATAADATESADVSPSLRAIAAQ